MKIFISWSGETSKQIAAALRDWLPTIIPTVTPFFTESDIEKGKYWQVQIVQNLSDTNFGILCLTPDNITSNWIHYEAGALAKDINVSNVIPITFGGLKPTGLELPLSLLQGREFTKKDMRSLATDINNKIENSPINEKTIDKYFKAFWADFENQIKAILEKADDATGPKKPPRDQRNMIEEILTILRTEKRETRNPALEYHHDHSTKIFRDRLKEYVNNCLDHLIYNDYPPMSSKVDSAGRIITFNFKSTPPPNIMDYVQLRLAGIDYRAEICCINNEE